MVLSLLGHGVGPRPAAGARPVEDVTFGTGGLPALLADLVERTANGW